MIKTDSSIHNICLAKIKRSTMNPYDFKWTNFYESKEEFQNRYRGLIANIESDELPICSTIINSTNWSVLTTRRLITCLESKLTEGYFGKTTNKFYGNFKDTKHNEWTFGVIELEDKSELQYFIESGRASMVMIQGVSTRIQIETKE